ncbi:MAG TPA: TonB-dependent receptor [Pyrinomonadaceae bacterium]|jgi:outer membrane receptor protein involved in Fe transport|nr:TonB-dependent receptor [Pyrinomonadaceae bacterium]
MKNVFKFIALSALLMSFALFAGSVFAQTSTTGSIEGSVTDQAGAAVPGISVKVSSANLISAQTATTDQSGRYRILNLPPGKYTVTVEADKGFAKFERSDVEINLSRSSSVEIQLQPAGAQASVTITDTAGAAVDVSGNTTGSNVSSDQFSNFPTQRTVQGLYTLAPTVTRSGLRDATGRDRDPSVAGASGPENNYILDGVNTTDPAFGGSGANLPFEFVQEVEIKTGAYGPEYGKSTGGIFNVITKSGGNEFHGDIYGYGTTKGLVREVKNFPFTGSAFNGFSEADVGGDIGGPIIKDKLWFFGAFNPQKRKNYYLTQTFHLPVNNDVTIPFYAGKVTWALSPRHTFTGSTFGDFTKIDGFLAVAALNNVNGFGDDITAFEGRQETGGHNYVFRLNSTFTNTFIAEISGGLHFQRANIIPRAVDKSLVTDNFAVLKNGAVLTPVQTGVLFGAGTGFLDFVDGRGGSLQRNFVRGPGFGLFTNQDRNRYEFNAHMQNIIGGTHTVKWGFEFNQNKYNINTLSSGPAVTYGFTPGAVNADGSALRNTNGDANVTNGARITNNWLVCTVISSQITCPNSAGVARAQAIPAATLAALGLTVNPTVTAISTAQAFGTPFLLRNTTRVRDFELVGDTYTNVESFYVGDDWKFAKNFQLSFGIRWDYQQSYGNNSISYLKFNNFDDNAAPRFGFIWDFTGKGRGKIFANYAQFIEAPIPLDVNVRAGGGDVQTDKNFNVNRLNAGAGALIVPGVSTGATNLGSDATPADIGLKPQSIREFTFGAEYEVGGDVTLGTRGVYRAMVNVIEDGSFDDGDTYFIFNPGRLGPGTTEENACAGDASVGRAPQCFGRAQRFYRGIEFTATKRFTNNFQFIASYVFSSLIGNYEGLFRNDNGQSDPNITSLFDLQSLLANTYGRLPNDRPHQFKFNGSYRTPWKLLLSGNFYAQSGVPFNQLIPHPIYGNNEGFAVQRGTAIIPTVSATQAGFPNTVESIGSNRTPTTMNLDLGVYYPIKVGEGKELRLTGDWFNVFNSQRAVTLDQTFSINSGVTGVPAVQNPFFGSALLVQQPSSFRFGAKFTF